MKVILIGHRGALGRGLYEYLSRSHQVTGWDVEEDLFSLDAGYLRDSGFDVVVNLALIADRGSPTYRIDSPSEKVNVDGPRHIARALKDSGIHWIQMSTREVLGPVYTETDVVKTAQDFRPRFLVGESQPYDPRNFYGKSKVVTEFIAESYPRTTIIRLTTGYTDYFHPTSQNWIIKVIQSVMETGKARLSNGGRQFRDPLHTDDLGALIERVVAQGIVGERLHAGGGSDNLISLRELVTLVDREVAIEDVPGGDWGFAFDNAKATTLTGWVPQVSIRAKIPVIAENIRNGITEAADVPDEDRA